MISAFRKNMIKWAAAVLALVLLAGCSSLNNPIKPSPGSVSQKDTAAAEQRGTETGAQQDTGADNPSRSESQASTLPSPSAVSGSTVYRNTQYGFNFTLPGDWKGYSIVNAIWEGQAIGGESGEKVVETGPIISIRDPRWTSQAPRQDIPIMVFTLAQWNSLQHDAFHIGAAPVGPSELGRNNSYVFALPARYNFAFPLGYEEVEAIINSNPLKTVQVSQQPGSTESLLSNMMAYAKQGMVINCSFSAKTNTIGDVESVWGKADKSDWVAAAKGTYAAYAGHNIVFGINKGDQIFEVRSFDSRLKRVTIAKTKEVLGNPVYDVKSNGQEIIGYTAGTEFKIEMVFPQPAKDNSDPVMDHYNVLYPQGTVNSMADDPGRQW